jgi:hypothetical protein
MTAKCIGALLPLKTSVCCVMDHFTYGVAMILGMDRYFANGGVILGTRVLILGHANGLVVLG